jgi:hypothetical protein
LQNPFFFMLAHVDINIFLMFLHTLLCKVLQYMMLNVHFFCKQSIPNGARSHLSFIISVTHAINHYQDTYALSICHHHIIKSFRTS